MPKNTVKYLEILSENYRTYLFMKERHILSMRGLDDDRATEEANRLCDTIENYARQVYKQDKLKGK